MNLIPRIAITTLVLALAAGPAIGAERLVAGQDEGPDLVANGAVDTLTAPGVLIGQIGQDTRDFGAFGVVTGPLRGAPRAAGQALMGGGRMLIGILDVLTAPFKKGIDHAPR